MSFAGHFNESMSESSTTAGKRERGKNAVELSTESIKKMKSLHGDENHVRNAPESTFDQQDYNSASENFMGSTSKVATNAMPDRNGAPKMEETLRKLGHDAKVSVMKWMPLFGESEAFEACCAARLDEILKQAIDLEQNLTEQKECLRARMKAVSRTLQAS